MRAKCLHRWLVFCAAVAWAGNASAQVSRINQPINDLERTVLAGTLHPKAVAAAQSGNDQGRVTPSLPMSYLTLTLAPSAAQQADLEKLLAEQQTPGSPNYHQWLTPEEFGQRFGASDADIATISAWIQSQGLQVKSVARGRRWIAVSGTAAQVEQAFRTEIHSYLVNGETHYANASEPSVPSAFAPLVKGVRGLNDFHMKPRARPAAVKPNFTAHNTSSQGNALAPDDFATIYDVTPLYNAGISGAGEKIAIAGQIEVNLSDIQQFRSMFNLPANDPQPMLV